MTEHQEHQVRGRTFSVNESTMNKTITSESVISTAYQDMISVCITVPTKEGLARGGKAYLSLDGSEGFCHGCNEIGCGDHGRSTWNQQCSVCSSCTCDDDGGAAACVTLDLNQAMDFVRTLRDALFLADHPQRHLIDEEVLAMETAL